MSLLEVAAHPDIGPRAFWQRPAIVLAAILGALATLVLLAALFPNAFYYPIVWKYYWGPVVADSAGTPLTRGGVTADPGYNLVDTTTWILIMGASLWTLLDAFRRRGIRFTRTLTLSFIPMIVAGGTMRGLVELDWLPEPWAYAFITPNIYVVFFLYSISALGLGLALEARSRGRIQHWHATLAAGLLATTITWAGWTTYILAAEAVRWIVLWEIFGYSAMLTASVVLLAWKFQFARDPLYVLALYGQIVDGMQNYIGITKGYTSKLMGPNFLQALGDPGLLVAKLVLIVPMLAYLKAKAEKDDVNVVQLILLAILALGLAMGFHGGVPMLIGE